MRTSVWTIRGAGLVLALALAPSLGTAQSAYRWVALDEAVEGQSAGIALGNDNRVHGNRLRFSINVVFYQFIASALGGPSFGNQLPRPVHWVPGSDAIAPAQPLLYSGGNYVLMAGSRSGAYQALVQQYLVGQRVYLAKGNFVTRLPSTPEALAQSGAALSGTSLHTGPLDEPHAVNDQGWIVGETRASLSTWPVLWRESKAVTLPIGEGNAGGRAMAINNRNVIVGEVWKEAYQNGYGRAASWVDGKLEWLLPASIAPSSQAVAINEAGQILVQLKGENAATLGGGIVDASGQFTALSPGKAVRVGDINAAGDAVGTSDGQPVLWRAGAEIPLMALWTSKGATLPTGAQITPLGINDKGSVLVRYTVGTAQARLALLVATP